MKARRIELKSVRLLRDNLDENRPEPRSRLMAARRL
jgi:hypothetical protein